MTWAFAMQYARQRANATARRWYVHGYRKTSTGQWVYAVYSTKQTPEALQRSVAWAKPVSCPNCGSTLFTSVDDGPGWVRRNCSRCLNSWVSR